MIGTISKPIRGGDNVDFMLKSDSDAAENKSAALKICTESLRDVSAISTGGTNHGIYTEGCAIYQGIASMLDSYCNAGERDAERIKTVAHALADLDNGMRSDMLSGSSV